MVIIYVSFNTHALITAGYVTRDSKKHFTVLLVITVWHTGSAVDYVSRVCRTAL